MNVITEMAKNAHTRQRQVSTFRGDRLKQIREQRGYSQDELAAEVGISQNQLSRWENGHTDPSTEAVTKLAKFLEVTADWLLDLTDKPNQRLQAQELSPLERRLIEAFRSGKLNRVLKILGIAFEDDDANGGNSGGGSSPKGKQASNRSPKRIR